MGSSITTHRVKESSYIILYNGFFNYDPPDQRIWSSIIGGGNSTIGVQKIGSIGSRSLQDKHGSIIFKKIEELKEHDNSSF
jgi:hypothetical protein